MICGTKMFFTIDRWMYRWGIVIQSYYSIYNYISNTSIIT